MALAAATTIASPLWFYSEKSTDTITTAEFLKEARARILGNVAITTDTQRISFVAGYLRGTAQHWWNTITRSKPEHDIEKWTGFLACFSEEFCVPVNKPKSKNGSKESYPDVTSSGWCSSLARNCPCSHMPRRPRSQPGQRC